MFVSHPEGGLDFDYLPEEVAKLIRRQAGTIRLLESDLKHIEERHGDQIRQAGFQDVIRFVDEFSKSYNAIYRGDKGTLFLVTDNPGTKAKNVIVRLTPMTGKEEEFWAIKTAAIMRRDYFRRRELLLLRDSPYHTQTPESGVPFSARTRAVSKMVEGQGNNVKSPLLQRDAPIARSLVARMPFGAGPEADLITLTEDHPAVNTRILQENQPMEPVFQYGPLTVERDPKSQALEISHSEQGGTATIQPDDPLHNTITKTITANPYSKGFVANQIHGLLERDGPWVANGLDDEGLSFGPSQAVEQQKPGMEVSEINLDSSEGKALLAELESQGIRLLDPAEYNRDAPEIPAVAQETAATLGKVQPGLSESGRADAAEIRTQLLDSAEYRPEKYQETGVPEIGNTASDKVQSILQQEQEKATERQRKREEWLAQNPERNQFLQEQGSVPVQESVIQKLPEGMRAPFSNPRIETRANVIEEGSVLSVRGRELNDKDVFARFESYLVADYKDPESGKEFPVTLTPLGKTGENGFVLKTISDAKENIRKWQETGITSLPDEKILLEKIETGRERSQRREDQQNLRPKEPDVKKTIPQQGKEEIPAPAREPEQDVADKSLTADWPGSKAQPLETATPATRFPRKNPPEVLLKNAKGKPHVLDHGDKVTVTNRAMLGVGSGAREKRQAAVETALQAAAQRFGEPVRFQGNTKFMAETIDLAIQRGIKLEPGNETARQMYELAKEKANQLGPSKSAPYRAPEKTKAVEKGQGLGI